MTFFPTSIPSPLLPRLLITAMETPFQALIPTQPDPTASLPAVEEEHRHQHQHHHQHPSTSPGSSSSASSSFFSSHRHLPFPPSFFLLTVPQLYTSLLLPLLMSHVLSAYLRGDVRSQTSTRLDPRRHRVLLPYHAQGASPIRGWTDGSSQRDDQTKMKRRSMSRRGSRTRCSWFEERSSRVGAVGRERMTA
jgi:hypothetical protein